PGHADPRFLAAASPVQNIVPAAQTGIFPDMIQIDFAGMTGHRFRHAEDIRPSSAQETVPEPHIRHQLSILPCTPADIILPGMPYWVVAMHDIPIIPESIPSSLLDLFLIEADQFLKCILD